MTISPDTNPHRMNRCDPAGSYIGKDKDGNYSLYNFTINGPVLSLPKEVCEPLDKDQLVILAETLSAFINGFTRAGFEKGQQYAKHEFLQWVGLFK